MKAILIVCALCVSGAALGDSLVLGRVVRSHVIEDGPPACKEDDGPKQPDELEGICMYSWWLWTIDVKRTVGGTALRGRTSAAWIQHSDMLPAYRKRLRLFALQPIKSSDQRKRVHADYYLIDMSPEMYCLWHDPQQFGLPKALHIEGSGEDKEYCFDLRPKE